jgi:TolB protein
MGNADLYSLDFATSVITRLTTNRGRDGFASWSPDGKTIAFQSEAGDDPDIWIMDPDGENKVPLVYRPGDDATPAWSPDGKSIAFTSTAAGNPDIWLVRRDDRSLTRLTDSRETDFKPAWSPDGRRIVYCRGPVPGQTGHARLWIMNADGSNPAPLSMPPPADPPDGWDEFDPAWSPDGQWIAFESDRGGDFDIWMVRAPQR